MTRERAIMEIQDLIRTREAARRPGSLRSDGFRDDILQHDDVTEALRVALAALQKG